MTDSPPSGKSPWGHRVVEEPFFCTITRIRLRSVWSLPAMFWRFRRVRREAKQVGQLKRAAFLVADARTFFILAVWQGEEGLLRFGTIAASHVDAVRQATSHVAAMGDRMEIWSTEWRIRAVSNNLTWGDANDWRDLERDAAGRTPSIEVDAPSVGGALWN